MRLDLKIMQMNDVELVFENITQLRLSDHCLWVNSTSEETVKMVDRIPTNHIKGPITLEIKSR